MGESAKERPGGVVETPGGGADLRPDILPNEERVGRSSPVMPDILLGPTTTPLPRQPGPRPSSSVRGRAGCRGRMSSDPALAAPSAALLGDLEGIRTGGDEPAACSTQPASCQPEPAGACPWGCKLEPTRGLDHPEPAPGGAEALNWAISVAAAEVGPAR